MKKKTKISVLLKDQFLLKQSSYKIRKISFFMKVSAYEASIICLTNMRYKYCCLTQSQYNLHTSPETVL